MPAPSRRALSVAAGSLLLTAGLLAGCASGDGTGPDTDRADATATGTTGPASPGPADTPTGSPDAEESTASPAATVLSVTIADGKVSPNAERAVVSRGSTVRIQVTSDAADAIHVHGYDKEVEVSAGTPASLEFVADTTGRFEIETHETDKLVYELVVQP
ncbi:cupredoxin domain-containing protein [Actinopolymorpha pittospori]